MDLIFVGGLAVLAGLTWALVVLCERVRGRR
jgi:hypothetical protein